MDHDGRPEQTAHKSDDEQSFAPILFFSYGSMCNPVSRSRRKLNAINARPAILPNHTLVFSRGTGDVKKNHTSKPPSEAHSNNDGVHGVLMEFHSYQEWESIVQSELGYYWLEEEVIPYFLNDGSVVKQSPIKARFFQFPGSSKEAVLPSERYLRIISLGLEHHRVDPKYIDWLRDQSCQPAAKPENYFKLKESEAARTLPTISYADYLKRAKEEHLFLIARTKVVQIQSLDANFAQWLMAHAVGKECLTWGTYVQLYEPDLPHCDGPEDLQEIHHLWAEHELCIYTSSSKCDVEHVMNLDITGK